MIYVFIHNQETVVDVFLFSKDDRRILCIMFDKVLLQNRRNLSCHDFCSYSSFSFGQHQQDTFIYIIINQYQSFVCRTYKISCKHISIKNLPIIKDAFYWR